MKISIKLRIQHFNQPFSVQTHFCVYVCIIHALINNLNNSWSKKLTGFSEYYAKLTVLNIFLSVPESLHSFHLEHEAHADYSGRTLHCRLDEEVSVYEDVVIFIFRQIDYRGNFIISLQSRTRSLPPVSPALRSPCAATLLLVLFACKGVILMRGRSSISSPYLGKVTLTWLPLRHEVLFWYFMCWNRRCSWHNWPWITNLVL